MCNLFLNILNNLFISVQKFNLFKIISLKISDNKLNSFLILKLLDYPHNYILIDIISSSKSSLDVKLAYKMISTERSETNSLKVTNCIDLSAGSFDFDISQPKQHKVTSFTKSSR